MNLSVVVLTHNNDSTLDQSLASVAKLAKEIIVVDSGSTDQTVNIARRYTDKIFDHKLTTFAAQRNWAAKKVTGDWLLFLDADESLSSKGVTEIKQVVSAGLGTSWRFKRKNIFYGRWLKYGGYWPDYQNRLFKVSHFKGVKGAVHEQYLYQGEIGTLSEPLIHRPERTIHSGLLKSAAWTRLEAKALHEAGHPSITAPRLIKVMIWEFCYRYFKKLGFLDGYGGFVEATYQAMNKFFVYQQVWEMQNENRSL